KKKTGPKKGKKEREQRQLRRQIFKTHVAIEERRFRQVAIIWTNTVQVTGVQRDNALGNLAFLDTAWVDTHYALRKCQVKTAEIRQALYDTPNGVTGGQEGYSSDALKMGCNKSKGGKQLLNIFCGAVLETLRGEKTCIEHDLSRVIA
ncbi:hypothetical protein ADUPG1_001959, partial [Aduncisulcus paluster]